MPGSLDALDCGAKVWASIPKRSASQAVQRWGACLWGLLGLSLYSGSVNLARDIEQVSDLTSLRFSFLMHKESNLKGWLLRSNKKIHIKCLAQSLGCRKLWWTYLALRFFISSYSSFHHNSAYETQGKLVLSPKFRDGSGLTNRSLKWDVSDWIKNSDFWKTANRGVLLFSGKAHDSCRPNKSGWKRYFFPLPRWMWTRKHVISAISVSHLVTTREASLRRKMR